MGARFTEHKQGPFLSKNQSALSDTVLLRYAGSSEICAKHLETVSKLNFHYKRLQFSLAALSAQNSSSM
jgi:hypothetical protein